MKRPFDPRGLTERSYNRKLTALARDMLKYFGAAKTIGDFKTAARRLFLSPELGKMANLIASGMVAKLSRADAANWKEAARKSTNGTKIYRALRREMAGPYAAFLKAQAARNAALIKNMPLDLAGQVTEFVMKESVKGIRYEELADALQEKFPGMARRKAETIARTETNKTHTAIVEARANRLNLPWYEWSAVISGTTRPGHRKLSGVLVSWHDPPSPEELAGEEKTYGKYHAGQIFNCRCEPLPIIEPEDVSWPHKVYTGGKIRMLGLKEFKKL